MDEMKWWSVDDNTVKNTTLNKLTKQLTNINTYFKQILDNSVYFQYLFVVVVVNDAKAK